MRDTRTIDQLKDLGAGRPAPEEVIQLYHQAFDKYGSLALWSSRRAPHPTLCDALAITYSLRVEGNRSARSLAEQIEAACRAAL